MEQWLERIGYAIQWLGDQTRGSMEHAAGAAEDLGEFAEEAWAEGEEELEGLAEEAGDFGANLQDLAAGLAGGASMGQAAGMVASAAGGWLATRLLADRDVRWGRAVLAGVIGTLFYDLTMLADQRVLGNRFDTIRPLGEALTDDPGLAPWLGWASHYAAGVGLAVLYARYAHGRLPGPPALRGATFGALDAATLTWGGVYPLLNRAVPGVRIPPGYAGLAHAPGITAQSMLRHVAYGVGIGVVYGDG